MKEEEEAPGKKRREKKSVHPELSQEDSQVKKEQSGVRLDDLNIYVKDIVLYRFGLCVN